MKRYGNRNQVGYCQKEKCKCEGKREDRINKRAYLKPNGISMDKVNRLGEDLIKSGYELEKALTKLLEAETRKINAIMENLENEHCKNTMETNEGIVGIIKYLKDSLYAIKEIEKIIKLKTSIGLYLLEEEKHRNNILHSDELEVSKEKNNQKDYDNHETEELVGFSCGFQYLLDKLCQVEEELD